MKKVMWLLLSNQFDFQSMGHHTIELSRWAILVHKTPICVQVKSSANNGHPQSTNFQFLRHLDQNKQINKTSLDGQGCCVEDADNVTKMSSQSKPQDRWCKALMIN